MSSMVSACELYLARSMASLVVLLLLVGRMECAAPKGLIAQYHFDEGSGVTVKDSSGNRQDGIVVGSADWVSGVNGTAIRFDGVSRVSIPSSALLSLTHGVTITVWIKGHGGSFRLVKEPSSHSSLRSPYFQVCGDKVHFTANSDDPKGWWESNEANLFSGSVDVNLSNWKDEQRTRPPFSGDEPKLQVVGDTIYYEYFGQDSAGAWQIWTARSGVDGHDYEAVQRTHKSEVFAVEQGGMQIVGNEIYYAWPQKDDHGWQTWTATSRVDGSDFRAAQRTTDGAAFVYQQVVGDKIYFLLNTSWGKHRDPGQKSYLSNLAIAVSERRGGPLRILKTIEGVSGGTGGASFHVTNGRVHFAYIQVDNNDRVNLFTGSMKSDGSGFRAIQRGFPGVRGLPGVPQLGIAVVGNKVYYALVLVKSDKTAAEASNQVFRKATVGREGFTFWTAEAGVDGSGWRATQRTNSPPDIAPQYKSIAVVGGKIYHSLMEQGEYREPYEPFHPYLGSSGANIVNKGDAYGLGLTEWNEARAFVNAGEDYLFRGEAPEDNAGAVIDSRIDDKWHFCAMTYDRKRLRLYVDGKLRSSTRYHTKIGSNPFPVMVGDGFVGAIDELSIYKRVLSSREILVQGRPGLLRGNAVTEVAPH
jgi:hypothetical protein